MDRRENQRSEKMKTEQKKCCHLVNELGVSWTDHQPCGRKATYTTDSGKPLCATHAKCKGWRKANPRQNSVFTNHPAISESHQHEIQ
jgi:hypothetical protein